VAGVACATNACFSQTKTTCRGTVHIYPLFTLGSALLGY
jgi:hypothetical protein